VSGFVYGIKPAVTGILAFAAWRIGTRTLRNATLRTIAGAAFIAIFGFGLPFPYIVLGAGLIGYMGGRIAPDRFAVGGGHDDPGPGYGAAIIDDTTPVPEHARFSWRRLIVAAIAGLFLWGGVIGILSAVYGWDGTLAQMAWFFTKAALLTFGGAYAVLPYVYQGGVEQYHWLSAAQMIDGLALGEITPGPLIMVVSFVGFVGGWSRQLFGPGHLLLAGCVAATVVTYFTFLPSFVSIFLGAPLIEATHGNLKFTAPLTAITAAVVGVILNLAVFFAYHVLWPRGIDGGFDIASALLGAAAAAVLFYFRTSVIPLILGCGALGFIYSLVIS
jgi:chromate transporter